MLRLQYLIRKCTCPGYLATFSTRFSDFTQVPGSSGYLRFAMDLNNNNTSNSEELCSKLHKRICFRYLIESKRFTNICK